MRYLQRLRFSAIYTIGPGTSSSYARVWFLPPKPSVARASKIVFNLHLVKDTVAHLTLEGKTYTLPLLEGTEGEKAIDVQPLRLHTRYKIQDVGYASTSSCFSAITFVDGEKGILHHRGYKVEDLAHKASFTELAYLLFEGELPQKKALEAFEGKVLEAFTLDSRIESLAATLPPEASPLALFSTLFHSLGLFDSAWVQPLDDEVVPSLDPLGIQLLGKIAALVALVYRIKTGQPKPEARSDLPYTQQLLYQLFGKSAKNDPCFALKAKALDTFLLLHADHEQNCSTATVRMIASSGGSLLSAIGGGLAALSGPLHGGANQAVINMLEAIAKHGDGGKYFIQRAKEGKAKLMGFGHRVYKNHDPRALILKQLAEALLSNLRLEDPFFAIAKALEQKALEDAYFIERRLYPNLDFYSGILLKALNIPLDFFTLCFAIGRSAGWFSHYKELALAQKRPLYRPRQVYMGPKMRPFMDINQR